MSTETASGRHCPLHYRYQTEALAQVDADGVATLYVVGGLYGNTPALNAIESLAERESGEIHWCFNGDFNWFNRDPERFVEINRRVLARGAIRGNVETEMVSADNNADCGCAYPEWVEQVTVERSNQIILTLRQSARRNTAMLAELAELPMFRCFQVAGQRVAVVHGDPESLAGWGLCQETIDDPVQQARIAQWQTTAAASVIASTHTCLPVLYTHNGGVVINNGAAGMPNFGCSHYGVVTRIADTPSPITPLYGTTRDGLFIDALAVHYDQEAWLAEFTKQWSPGTPAYESYFARLTGQLDYQLEHAVRLQVTS